ncbi:MAG: hypothetical protein K6A72_04725 [Lachnospiraceae bacterium]|nr:hypothetical protein [Lachnospiraceae bacterium]
MKECVLSAKAILYIAKEAGATRFFGLPNVYGDLDGGGIKRIDSEAQDELSKAGVIAMDFDGKSNIDEELKAAIKICSNVSHITGIDLKNKDKSISKLTVFLDRNDERYLMTTFGQPDGKYLFSKKSKDEIAEFIKDCIKVPEGGNGDDTILETKLLYEPESSKLAEAGCEEKKAELIAKAINGGVYAMTSRRLVNTVEDLSLIYIWNDSEVLRMKVSYEDEKENMHFIPVTADDVYSALSDLMERPVYPETEEDLSIASPEEDAE